MKRNGEQNFLEGALVLTVATVAVKVIGALFKIPLANILGGVGMSYYVAAYDIFTPLYSMTVTGLGIAVSRMVSQYAAQDRSMALSVFRTSRRIFLLLGFSCAAVMLLAARAFSSFISNPGAVLSIMAIAPAIVFTCLSAAYRGYYQGMANMIPTAMSQVLEAAFKLIFGTALSYGTTLYLRGQYDATGMVLGARFDTAQTAAVDIMRYSAAAAILGVTLSTVAGTIYIAVLHHRSTLPAASDIPAPKGTAGTLIRIAVPISLATLVVNLTAVIDLTSVMNCLKAAVADSSGTIKTMYAGMIPLGVTDDLIPEYLYGSYSGLAFSIFNLTPSLTAALGISAIPSVTRAWAALDRDRLEATVASILRVTLLVALPAGAGIFALSPQILALLYPARAMEAAIVAPVLRVMGISTVFVAVATPINSILQATGNERLPLAALSIGALVKLAVNFTLVSRPDINIQGVPYGTLLCYLLIVIICSAAMKRRLSLSFGLISVAAKPFFCAVLCGAAAYFSYRFLSVSGGLRTVCAIVIAAVVYLAAVLFTRTITQNDISMLPISEKFVDRLEKAGFIG